MSNKRLTIKRIVIYCVIAYLPLCIMAPVLNSLYGEMIFVSEKATVAVYLGGAFGMFAPTLANILTRLITKEGFKNSYLGLHLEGNIRYYLASMFIIPLGMVFTVFLIYVTMFRQVPFGEFFSGEDMGQKIALVVLQFAYSVIVFFPAFGEEFGWRGYLGPKLNEIMSKPAAIVVGGIIWGLWHAPLTISGHNFGVDYPLYPWLGMFYMCVFCTLMNAFLTLLTERTKSIYPASFCHMINNNLSFGVLISIFASEKAVELLSETSQMTMFVMMLPMMAIIGGISFVLWMKKETN